MNTSSTKLESLINKTEEFERKARRRSLLYTAVPILFAGILIWFSGNKVVKAQKEVNTLQKTITDLNYTLERKHEELATLLTNIEDAEKNLEASDYESAKQSLIQATTELDWFAVLASYKDSELKEAQDHAKKISNQLAEQGEPYLIDIYKTRISKNYALTVGGRLSKPKALELAKLAREKGWAHDAFAQVDKSWILLPQWGIVIGGDNKLESALTTVDKTETLGFKNAQIFKRKNSFRTVLIYYERHEAEMVLEKAKSKSQIASDSYVVNLDEWCNLGNVEKHYIECTN